jgi:Tfp pilus assembly protein PilZ
MKARDRFFVDDVECSIRGMRHRVANLSLGGLFAETDRPPRPGEILLMELMLPSRRACQVVGQVAWINDHWKPRVEMLPPGFGAAVTWVQPFDREHVATLLQHCSPVLGPPRDSGGD